MMTSSRKGCDEINGGRRQSAEGGGEEYMSIASPEPDPSDSQCGHLREVFHRGKKG